MTLIRARRCITPIIRMQILVIVLGVMTSAAPAQVLMNPAGVSAQPVRTPMSMQVGRHWKSTEDEMIRDVQIRPSQYGDEDIEYSDDDETVELSTGPAPNVQGDFFDGVGLGLQFGPTFAATTGNLPDSVILPGRVEPNQQIALSTGGDRSVRRIKISENNSPLPRNRVFFNYNFFNDVRSGYGDVNRYTVGAEILGRGGLYSLEIRAPMAGTVPTDQILGVPPNDRFEWGNIVFALKGLLLYSDSSAITAGTGLSLPTADDSSLSFAEGLPIAKIENQAVHLLPYVAAIKTSGDFFFQGFIQCDLDLNGNPVLTTFPGGPLNRIGKFQDSNLLFVDLSTGVWLHRNVHATVTGIAAQAELHYATTLQDSDVVSGNDIDVSNLLNRFDVLNLTLGTTTQIRNQLDIATGFVIPLRSGLEQFFDYEFLLQVNRRF